MAGFIETAAEGAFQISLDRARKKIDLGSDDHHPDFDPKQRAELVSQMADGKVDDHRFHQALEYHGFVWYPLPKLRQLPGTVAKMEGEWRHDRLKMAFTPTDLATSFQTPEELDRHLRDHIATRKVSAGKLPKAELRKMRKRRSFG